MEKGQEAISGPAQGDQVSIKCCMGSISGGLGVEASIGSGYGYGYGYLRTLVCTRPRT